MAVTASQGQMEILSKPTPELSTVNRGTGSKENGILIFETIILMILEFYGLEWSALQIRECAEMGFAEYYWLQVGELKHFVLKAKQGDFRDEKDFSRLTPVMLMMWFKAYANESLRIRQENYLSDSYSATSNERADARIKEWNKSEDDFRMSAEMNKIKDELKSNQPKNDAA